MKVQDLVDRFNALTPENVVVVQGPRLEDIPDHLWMVTKIPVGLYTMEGQGETVSFTSMTRPAAFDPVEAENLAMMADELWLKLAGEVVGGRRVIWSDRVSPPAPTSIDDGERGNWQGTYILELTG